MKKEIVNGLESLMRFMYGWITDNDEVLGNIVYVMHIFALNTIAVLYVISHTLYPVFWFQTFVFVIGLIVWLQHIVLHTCVCTSLERRLLGPDGNLAIDVVLNLFDIPVSKETRIGVTLLMSSLSVLFMGFELTARSVLFIREQYSISTWV